MKKILKLIYSAIPFKKDVFLLLKKVWTPKEWLYRHFHFKSPYTVAIDKTKSFKIYNQTRIENEIFWEGLTGRWEKESMKLWIKLSENSKSIYDIGANNGVYALVAKTINPESEVFAFEPHPLFYESLKRNIALNNYQISTYQKAVSDCDGSISFEDYSGEKPSIDVESITLDSFMLSQNMSDIDLLKIDVETFEPQVVKGFVKQLKLNKPTLLIEILTNEVAQSVNDLVSDLGYVFFNIDERSGIRQTEVVEKSDYHNYLICQESVAKKIGLIGSDV